MKKEEFKNKKDNVLAIIGILFFIGLAIFARMGTNKNNQGDKPTPTPTATPTTKPGIKEEEETVTLEKNYHFTYTVEEDGQTEIIDGKVNGNKAKFTIIGTGKEEYAKISDNYLKLVGKEYKIMDTEVRFYFPYIELDDFKELLGISKEDFEDQIKIYYIDTTDLLDEYTDIEYNGFEDFEENKIKIYANKEKQIYKIELDYSAYFTYVNKKETTFKVTMEFDKFGSIEELEI